MGPLLTATWLTFQLALYIFVGGMIGRGLGRLLVSYLSTQARQGCRMGDVVAFTKIDSISTDMRALAAEIRLNAERLERHITGVVDA